METFFERLKNILVTPRTEWQVISDEDTSIVKTLLVYILPLSIISVVPLVANGGEALEQFGIKLSLDELILMSVTVVPILTVLSVMIQATIIYFLAGYFGGEKNFTKAVRLNVFSSVPSFLAAGINVAGFLLVSLAGSAYTVYLLWTGLSPMMKPAEEKKNLYLVWIICTPLIPVLIIMLLMSLLSFAGST